MDTKKKSTKRLKPATRYRKNNSTYVVAFALHETYDDLATAQQMICSRKSPKNSLSVNSLTVDSDAGSNDSNPTRYMNQEQNPSDSTRTNIFNQHSRYYDVQELLENQKGDANPPDQPEVIFSAQFKRHKNKKQRTNIKFPKKSHKKGVFDIRNISFKCRNNKAKIINKLGKFYSRARNNSASDNLRLCTNSIINIVSKTRILKKVLAKENLLDTDSLFDGVELDQNESIKSSVSTVKNYLSSSQNTLVRNSSIISDDDKEQSEPEVPDSVIDLPVENAFPYKTDVLNVAVAVTYNPSNENKTNETSEEKLADDTLTSSPLTAQSSGCLTSHPENDSSNEPTNSDLTLTGSDNELPQYTETDSDLYLFAESNSISKTIFIPDLASQDTIEIRNNPTFHKIPDEKKTCKKQTLLDTVINLGIYSELNSTNSAHDLNINDQLTESISNAEDSVEEITNNNMGDHQSFTEKKSPIDTHQKPVTNENTINVQRNILPSEEVIRNILMDRENLRKKSCASDIGTHPTTISELWEKIVVRLDLTVKRLEDSLAEKVVKELLKSAPVVSKFTHPIPISIPDRQPIEEALSAKPLTFRSDEIIITADESVQCDLVKRQIIDNIMLKLSIQNTKPKCYPSTSKIPLKIKKPKLTNDFVEVLKPPAVQLDVEKGETVTISTDSSPIVEPVEYNRLEQFKSVFYVPVAFARENIIIIASVTNFMVILMCVYVFFVVIMKP
ncbi:uncharacterized protein LOC128681070 isoform X2 [Plodia interpunctella]|uniref:uncharacterized protein LOC128681070 isoform X2 n=1 Tax=Plodia interpunctella TaxID=58824 RepID=UPI0023679E3F|nr:uncharacterized protein LOC128681070 isoform X3 [Plodia interpunctella]